MLQGNRRRDGDVQPDAHGGGRHDDVQLDPGRSTIHTNAVSSRGLPDGAELHKGSGLRGS